MRSLLRALLFALLSWHSSAGEETLRSLREEIFKTRNYKYDDLPDATQWPVKVMVDMVIRSIDVEDEATGTHFIADMTYRESWFDNRLTFNPSQFRETANTSYWNFPEGEQIWMPDTFFQNSYSSAAIEHEKWDRMVRVNGSGGVTLSVRLQHKFKCNMMDFKYYPWDRHECRITLASYGYTTDQIKYVWGANVSNAIQAWQTLALHNDNWMMCQQDSSQECKDKKTQYFGTFGCLSTRFMFCRLGAERLYMTFFVIPGAFVMISWFAFLLPQWHKFGAPMVLFLFVMDVMASNQVASDYPLVKNSIPGRFHTACGAFMLAEAFALVILYFIVAYFERNSPHFAPGRVSEPKTLQNSDPFDTVMDDPTIVSNDRYKFMAQPNPPLIRRPNRFWDFVRFSILAIFIFCFASYCIAQTVNQKYKIMYDQDFFE